MRTQDELREIADNYVEREDDVSIWSNPDVPPFEEIVQTDTETFDCPYDVCADDFEYRLSDDPDQNRDGLIQMIEEEGGTLRCDECGEPIYGIRGRGDHS